MKFRSQPIRDILPYFPEMYGEVPELLSSDGFVEEMFPRVLAQILFEKYYK